jgi:pyruvate dehydrogenase E2 component (dihydrolipoamide acetyltransferase)
MGLRTVKLRPLRHTPPFRAVALGTWAAPGDPQIYGTLEIDLTRADAWRASLPPEAPRVTVTHMVARAMGLALGAHPDLNGLLRWRKVYLRQSVDLACLVAVQHDSGREDLTSVRLAGVDRRSVPDIAAEMAAKVAATRTTRDTPAQRTARMMALLPGLLVRFLLWFSAFLTYTLNLRLPGLPGDLFGACLVTSVGSLGLDVAYAPLVPYSRAPIVLLVGEARLRPVVVEGRIEARNVVTLNATIDHRFCDGALVAKMVRVIRAAFDDPQRWFGGAEPYRV